MILRGAGISEEGRRLTRLGFFLRFALAHTDMDAVDRSWQGGGAGENPERGLSEEEHVHKLRNILILLPQVCDWSHFDPISEERQ